MQKEKHNFWQTKIKTTRIKKKKRKKTKTKTKKLLTRGRKGNNQSSTKMRRR